jgi:rhodanese-related sulfurtransferase
MKYIARSIAIAGIISILVSCLPASPSAEASTNGAAAQPPAIESRKLPATLAYDDLVRLLADESAGVLLLDVRTQEEFSQGHIDGAVLSPYDALESSFKEQDKARPIVVYCRSGNRSSIALKTLSGMGYTNLSDFGGIGRWRGNLVK